MSKFIAPDLRALPPLPIEEPDFEKRLEERLALFKQKANEQGIDYDVEMIEGDPIVIDQRVGADREVEVISDHNDKVKAVMLATSWGEYLDHIGKTFYGVGRLKWVDPETGEEQKEEDEDYRLRLQLAPEAFSTAGPQGAYIFHGLELDGIRDVADIATYSEEDSATYSEGLHADAFSMGKRLTPFESRNTGDPVLAPEILQVILPIAEYGPCDQALLDRSWEAVNPKKIRPCGDNVRCEPAKILNYPIEVTLKVEPGTNHSEIRKMAEAAFGQYAAEKRKIGFLVQPDGIAARLNNHRIRRVNVIQPNADIDPGSKGACECDAIIIKIEDAEATWRATP